MITGLQITNFKGWKDTGPIKLAPITVLFGTNSSGKSSIGQFLMMLKQTAASPDRGRVLHPGDIHTPVDLGTYEDLVFRHEMSREITFEVSWCLPEALMISEARGKGSAVGDRIAFSATIGFGAGKVKKAVCKAFKYELRQGELPQMAASMTAQQNSGEYQLAVEGLKLVRRPGRPWPLPAPTRFFGFPDEMTNYYQNAGGLADLALAMQEMLRRLSYLGPLREEPKRGYPWTGETPEDVGRRGEQWISAFLAASERRLSSGHWKRKKRFDEVAAAALQTLGVIHSFKVTPVAQGGRDYRVQVQTGSGGASVGIPDVGFGVSQVLPVVVQCFYAAANSTVVVEQPELHLHPAVQQNLADLFISAAQICENGAPRNVQFIVESHSEHFLRRLQRRVAEGSLPRDALAAYFCDTGPDGSRLTPLDIDAAGNIRNWPKDFFGDQMSDIAEMQLAGLRKRQAETEV